MNEKRIKITELITMPKNEFLMYSLCLRTGLFNFLGIFWKKYIEIFHDKKTGDLVIKYE